MFQPTDQPAVALQQQVLQLHEHADGQEEICVVGSPLGCIPSVGDEQKGTDSQEGQADGGRDAAVMLDGQRQEKPGDEEDRLGSPAQHDHLSHDGERQNGEEQE